MKAALLVGLALSTIAPNLAAAENKLGRSWTFGSIVVEQA
jgi:hypothetical protein